MMLRGMALPPPVGRHPKPGMRTLESNDIHPIPPLQGEVAGHRVDGGEFRLERLDSIHDE